MLTSNQIHKKRRIIRRALVRHWRLAGMVAAAIFLLVVLALRALPPMYSSEARLLARFDHENLPLESAATTDPLIPSDESRASEMNSLLEVLKSRAMLDRLADSLGSEYMLTGRGEPQPFQAAATPAATPPTAAQQQAVHQLQRNVEVRAQRNSDVISVECRANSPALAQKIATRLVEIYLDQAARMQRPAVADETSANREEHSKTQWQAAAARLDQEKDKLDVATIDGRRQQLQNEIADIDAKLRANQSDLKTSEARIASLQEQIAALPKTLVPQETPPPGDALENVPAALLALESREQELASTRSDNHPQLVAIRQQLAELRATLRQPSSQSPPPAPATTAAATTPSVDPARSALEVNLRNEQSQAAAFRGRETALTAQASKLRGDLKQLDAQVASLGELQHDVDAAEERYKADADKLEQAHSNRALADERIVSLTVVQPATLPTDPAGPRRANVLTLGAAVAVLCGLASALVAACFQRVLATPTDLARLWDLPLVGVLPPLDQRLAAAS